MLGAEKRISLGKFPEVSLAETRKQHEEMMAFVRLDKDPVIERQRAKLIASPSAKTTFYSVAREFIDKRANEGLSETTTTKSLWLLEQLKPPEVLAALKRIEAQGKYETARGLLRRRAAISFTLQWWTERPVKSAARRRNTHQIGRSGQGGQGEDFKIRS